MIGRGEDMTSNDDMTDFYEQLAGVVPLPVREVEIDDPLVTIFGDNWSLNLSCPWDLLTPHGAVVWDDPRLEDAVWDLVGLWLRRIERSDDGNPHLRVRPGLSGRGPRRHGHRPVGTESARLRICRIAGWIARRLTTKRSIPDPSRLVTNPATVPPGDLWLHIDEAHRHAGIAAG